MDGLRYYVGSVLLIACATTGHVICADREYKERESQKLKICAIVPTEGGSRLGTSARDFLIEFSSDAITIEAIKKLFEQEIEKFAKKAATCHCGLCQDIRAAKILVRHKNKPLQFAYSSTEAKDAMTLAQLKKLGFSVNHSALYAKFDEKKEGA